ncbi:glutathione S-transferase [Litorivivens lipolytica]|uniref:Glutathione S-transferase n=1 Tax=Litorivivens lipolytica TaxID=1524264 RepID=A0A7W4W5S6_9GAMM|nr:glutathione S-transferase family protein [Litorivivens lipolytica]MBB3047950.1 glutathione S-transferase [Litorivivens lipolytica]
MKLYSVPHSPYASRIRIQILAGKLPIEVAAPEGGLGSESFKAMTPTGKVPALEVDGSTLVESAAIMEFLEERFPEQALMPTDPLQRAWLRSVGRFTDLDLAQALFPLFLELKLKSGDSEAIAKNLDALKARLATLEKFLSQPLAPALSEFGFLDCLLAPTLFYVVKVPAIFGEADILSATPLLKQWWHAAAERKQVAPVLDEMSAGLAAMMGS